MFNCHEARPNLRSADNLKRQNNRVFRLIILIFLACMICLPPMTCWSDQHISLDFLFSIQTIEGGKFFKSPQGIFFHQQKNKIYIIDTGGHKVYKADKDGSNLQQVLKDVELKSPYDLVADKKDRIYISQLGENFISVYNQDGQLERNIPDKGEARLMDIAIMPGRLCLNEKNRRIFTIDRDTAQVYVFNYKGDYLFHFGGKGKGKGKFSMISGIALDFLDRIIGLG